MFWLVMLAIFLLFAGYLIFNHTVNRETPAVAPLHQGSLSPHVPILAHLDASSGGDTHLEERYRINQT